MYSEVLGIHISERDFNDAPGGIAYEVVGESCIPGKCCPCGVVVWAGWGAGLGVCLAGGVSVHKGGTHDTTLAAYMRGSLQPCPAGPHTPKPP